MKSPLRILVLYYSRHGSVETMANKVAFGIEKAGCEAVLRTVPSLAVPSIIEDRQQRADDFEDRQKNEGTGDAFVTEQDLKDCHAIALGSPARFGNMAASMKQFWETTSIQWLSGDLIDKPASVFTSSSSMHGGNESTLLTMMLPLLHHGMLIQGLPYSEPALNATLTGGTPYGASHVAGLNNDSNLSADETELCIALGFRLAQTTRKLNQ
ncbi:MAG: NAD(P)H:quinone oxidoreductase [Algicola sp.]|nr:NAD(P)H:quinone oxidoreductase [Algicola sp.]